MSQERLTRRALAFVGIGGLALASCNSHGMPAAGDDSLNSILRRRRVSIGFVDLKPWASRDPNSGRVTGWYVDLASQIFADIGVSIDFAETQWSTFVAGVQSGRFDFSIVPSYPTIDRAASIAFTRKISSLANSALVLASRTDLRNVSDLNRPGTRIAALSGEQSVEFVKEHLSSATLHVISSGDFSLLYSEVIAGRADAAMGYVDSISRFSQAHPATRDISAGKPYSDLPICWSTQYRSIALREFLNSAITYLDGNGILSNTSARYST